MSAPAHVPWEDDPADLPVIERNAAALVSRLLAEAPARALPTEAVLRVWHTVLYAGCAVPEAEFVGHFRGDPAFASLVDYEVGVGPDGPDGLPERVGVWSAQLAAALAAFFTGTGAALSRLDAVLPVSQPPSTVAELEAVVTVTALVHGEWVRLHPFINGNGRTARLLAAFIALRYSLPIFVSVKPRPGDVAYQRAARESMGRPPLFRGDHGPAIATFGHMLTLQLLP